MINHGEAGKNKTKEYRSWAGVITRCTNIKHKRYAEWGGRGITVCDRWRKYENFLADMGRAPSALHSIDRMENDKGYYKDNCRWATPMEQSNNTRRTVIITYKGVEKPLRAWCDELGLKYRQVGARLFNGWTPERAFETPMTKSGDIQLGAKFVRDEVLIIREALRMQFPVKAIAGYFKTPQINISRIKTGITYKHIQA